MNCYRCKKPLVRGYYYNGNAYGPECIKKVAGRKVKLGRLKKVKIDRNTDKSVDQLELFDD